jgi:predicted RNA-binding protein with PUA-like domain
MQYWLMKTEPDVLSIDSLQKVGRTGWDSVRNYQARNYMRDSMKMGDLVFIYHSNAEPSGIAGLAKVSKLSHPDPTQFDKKSDYYDPKATPENPRWFQVEVSFVEKFSRTLALHELKNEMALAQMQLLRPGNRLSITPVTPHEWKHILKLAHSNL